MIFYLLLTLLAFQSARLLRRGQLVTALGINLSSNDFKSGDDSAPYTAVLNAAKTFLEFGDSTSPITIPKIDMGSNSDGNWLKVYEDANTGFMICWITTASGLESNDQIDLPQSFASSDYVVVCADSFADRLVGAHDLNTSEFEATVRGTGGDPASTNADTWWVAIGEFDDS